MKAQNILKPVAALMGCLFLVALSCKNETSEDDQPEKPEEAKAPATPQQEKAVATEQNQAQVVFGKSLHLLKKDEALLLDDSEKIPWEQDPQNPRTPFAQDLLKGYSTDNGPKLKVCCKTGDDQNLYGYRVDVALLEDIIYGEGVTVRPPAKVKEIILMPSAHPKAAAGQTGHRTMIIAGIKTGGTNGKLKSDLAIEYSDPCPPHCPDNFYDLTTIPKPDGDCEECYSE